MSRFLTLSTLLVSLLAAGCSYFRLPILQGNIVDYEKAEQLELGMTPRQVEFLLGTPLIRDSFGSPRWDYVVYYRSPQAEVIHKNLSIYFENDVVSRIKGRKELLADWRKQRAAVKKAKKLLDTPHPGQLPANAGPVDPQNPDEPHPVIPPANKEVLKNLNEPKPKPAAKEPSAAAPNYTQQQKPANETAPAADSTSESEAEDYPPDMTTIYTQ